MKRKMFGMFFVLLTTMCVSVFADCPAFMVRSGSTCIDQFEASLWRVTNRKCIALIKQGKPYPGECIAVSTQLGLNGTDYVDSDCSFNGAGCKNIFALSLPHKTPAHTVNYFIAAAACRNSGKRLPTNAEWQVAALGTPDPWPQDDPANECNLNGAALTLTGVRSKCISDVDA